MRWEKWKQSEAMEKGGGPGKRWGHTCNAIRGGKLLYVFGGYGQSNSQTNQVHVFDTGVWVFLSPLLHVFVNFGLNFVLRIPMQVIFLCKNQNSKFLRGCLSVSVFNWNYLRINIVVHSYLYVFGELWRLYCYF